MGRQRCLKNTPGARRPGEKRPREYIGEEQRGAAHDQRELQVSVGRHDGAFGRAKRKDHPAM